MSDDRTVSDLEFERVMQGGEIAWVGVNTVYLMRDEIRRLRAENVLLKEKIEREPVRQERRKA